MIPTQNPLTVQPTTIEKSPSTKNRHPRRTQHRPPIQPVTQTTSHISPHRIPRSSPQQLMPTTPIPTPQNTRGNQKPAPGLTNRLELPHRMPPKPPTQHNIQIHKPIPKKNIPRRLARRNLNRHSCNAQKTREQKSPARFCVTQPSQTKKNNPQTYASATPNTRQQHDPAAPTTSAP
jgi:hypothetical protein